MPDSTEQDEARLDKFRRISEFNRQRDRRRNLVSNLTLTGMALAALLTGISFFLYNKGVVDFTTRDQSNIVGLQNSVEAEKSEISALKLSLDSITANRVSNRDQDLKAISSRIDDLDRRQAEIERVVETSPEKALAIPMMRSEIDDFKSKTDDDILSLSHHLDAFFDLIKGTLFAIIAGIFGSVALLIFKSLRQNAE